MIIAGETSGDLHGADLVTAMKAMRPAVTICGMGGAAMAAAGVDILHDSSNLAVMGVTEVIGKLRDIRKTMKTLEQSLRNEPPDLLILIDYPGFNLVMANKAKQLKIPVMYYISPKVWAWNAGRVKKIKQVVDRMAVILPFEKDFYARYGLEVDFVGNPLLDQVRTRMSRDEVLRKYEMDGSNKVIGILPGSRQQEIVRMLPVFSKAARYLQSAHTRLLFLLFRAPGITGADLIANGLHEAELNIKVISQDRYDLMAACDICMAASGTVTLELAIVNTPMVVAYCLSPFTYLLARHLVRVSSVSLVNLVAGEEVVPELLQREATPANISRELLKLLNEEDAYSIMKEKLKGVSERLGKPGASNRAAELALGMLS
jgi:lipid-A-disaccharide synthase